MHNLTRSLRVHSEGYPHHAAWALRLDWAIESAYRIALGAALALASLCALECWCLSQRDASLLSLFDARDRVVAWPMILRGPTPALIHAKADSEKAMEAFRSLDLPGARGLYIFNAVRAAPSKINSHAWPTPWACATIHDLGLDGSGFAQADFESMGGQASRRASITFATGHEAAHCSFHKKISDQGASASELAELALRGDIPAGPERQRAAAWLAKAWSESYADLIGMALMARQLGDPAAYSHFGSLMLSHRVLTHIHAVSSNLMRQGSGMDLESLGPHYTQFALQAALWAGQRKMATMRSDELEQWAMQAALSTTARGMLGAPEFRWLAAHGPVLAKAGSHESSASAEEAP